MMDAGVVEAGGFFTVGGNDTSPHARDSFARRSGRVGRAVVPTTGRAIELSGLPGGLDVVFACPPSRGLEVGAPVGSALHASALYVSTVSEILKAGPSVGVVESSWELSTAGGGGVLSQVRKAAVASGYVVHHRLVSPHRLPGGSECRLRLYLLFVRGDVQAAAGDPPLVQTNRGQGEVHRCVRESLLPDVSEERQRVRLAGPVRWRQRPQRVGAALLVGHFGRDRDGPSNSVWSVDAAAPPNDSSTQSVYFIDGELVRLTAREEARVRGIGESVDIGESKGEREAKEKVRRAPSKVSVKTIAGLVKDYLHRAAAAIAARDVEQVVHAGGEELGGGEHLDNGETLDGGERPEGEAKPRAFPNGAAQFESATAGVSQARQTELLDLANGTPERARAIQFFLHQVFVRLARREVRLLREGEQGAHARVVSDLVANVHGFAFAYKELAGEPYREIVVVPLLRRALLFWRWRDEEIRAWARDGAPAFRFHEFRGASMEGNYASGDDEAAIDFVRGYEVDRILERVEEAKAKALIASEYGAVNPIACIPKSSGGYRFLSDSKRSGANFQLAARPSKFPEPIHAIHSVVPLGGYCVSSDYTDCFYGLPLSYEDSFLFMVQIRGVFYRFKKLPMGARNSPPVCLAFNYSANEQWREDLGRDIVREQVPGEQGFDPGQPAVLWVDERGRRDSVEWTTLSWAERRSKKRARTRRRSSSTWVGWGCTSRRRSGWRQRRTARTTAATPS
jgi:hypothetical protein